MKNVIVKGKQFFAIFKEWLRFFFRPSSPFLGGLRAIGFLFNYLIIEVCLFPDFRVVHLILV